MANDNAKDLAKDLDRVWDLMKKIGFAILVSRDGSKLRALPMVAYVERDQNAVYGIIVSYVKMAAAAVSGTRPDLGDNRKVAI
jgi:hypothetical protein